MSQSNDNITRRTPSSAASHDIQDEIDTTLTTSFMNQTQLNQTQLNESQLDDSQLNDSQLNESQTDPIKKLKKEMIKIRKQLVEYHESNLSVIKALEEKYAAMELKRDILMRMQPSSDETTNTEKIDNKKNQIIKIPANLEKFTTARDASNFILYLEGALSTINYPMEWYTNAFFSCTEFQSEPYDFTAPHVPKDKPSTEWDTFSKLLKARFQNNFLEDKMSNEIRSFAWSPNDTLETARISFISKAAKANCDKDLLLVRNCFLAALPQSIKHYFHIYEKNQKIQNWTTFIEVCQSAAQTAEQNEEYHNNKNYNNASAHFNHGKSHTVSASSNRDQSHKDASSGKQETVNNNTDNKCFFFLKPRGCKLGNKCKFQHDPNADITKLPIPRRYRK